MKMKSKQEHTKIIYYVIKLSKSFVSFRSSGGIILRIQRNITSAREILRERENFPQQQLQ